MGVAMGRRGARRLWAEGPSASDPTLGLSGADWSGGFSSGGSGGWGPSLGSVLAGPGTRGYQPQAQLVPQHPHNHQHINPQHQQTRQHHPLQQREKAQPSPLLPREPPVRRCYTQPLGPAATSEGIQRAQQPLPGGTRQPQAPHLPPRSDPTSLQVQRLQLTAKQEGQSRFPGRGRVGRRTAFEEEGQGPRKGRAWAWLLQHQWCIPRGNPGNDQGSNQGSNQGSSASCRVPTPCRGPQQQAAADPSRVSPGQRASRHTDTPQRSKAPARRRSLSSPSSRQAQARGQATSRLGLRSKHPMSGPVASSAGSCRTAPGPGGFMGRGAARKLAQDSPGMRMGMGSSGIAELHVTAEDSSSVPASVSSLAGGAASSGGTDGGGRGCSSGEDTMSLCSLNSSTTSLSTSSSGSARGGLPPARGAPNEPKDSPTEFPHKASDASPAPRPASKPPGPTVTVPLHEDSGEVQSAEDHVQTAASEASPGSERDFQPEEKGSPVSDLPLPPGRQGRAAPSRVRSGHPSVGLRIKVPQRGEALMQEEAWQVRAQKREAVRCQPQTAAEGKDPVFKKSWSGPLAAMTANGLRPDLPSRGGNRLSTQGDSPTKDPTDAVWDARAAAVPARPPRIPPPLPRFPGLPAPRNGATVPMSPTLGALGRAASCSASSLEAASPAAGPSPAAPEEGPEVGQCLRRSQSVQRDPAEPRNGAPKGAEARNRRALSAARRTGEGPADTVWRWKNLQVQAQRMGLTGLGAAERGNDKVAAGNGALHPAHSPTPSSRRRSGRERNLSAGPGPRAASMGRQRQQGPKDGPALESPSEEQAADRDEVWDDLRISEGSEEGEGSSQGQAEEGEEEEVDFSAIFSQKRADRKQGRPVGIVPAFGRPLSQPRPQPQPQPQEDPQGQRGASEDREGGSQPKGKELQTPGYLTYTEHVRGRGAPEQQGGARPGLETGRGTGAPGSLEGGAQRPPLEMGQALRSRQGEAQRPHALGAAGTPRGGGQSQKPPLFPSSTPARGTGAGGKHNGAAAAATPARAAGREGEAKGSPAAPSPHALTAASPRTLKLRTISQHIQPSSPLFTRAAQSSAYIQVQRSSSATSSSRPTTQAPAARPRAPPPPSRPPLPGSRPKPRPWEGQEQERQLALRGGRAAPQHGVPGAAAWGDLPALGLGLQALVRRATGERERGRDAQEGQGKGGSHRAGRAAKGESGATGAPAPEEQGDGSAPPPPPEDHPDYSLLFSQAREERRKGRVSPILPCALQPGKGTPDEASSPFW